MARLLPLLALALVGCARTGPTPPDVPNVVVKPPGDANDGRVPIPREVPYKFPAASLTRGVAYLLKQQSPDGAWRSDVYATFKDGTALTPLAVVALQDALDSGEANPDLTRAIRNGCSFLMKFHKPTGIDAGPDGFDYPIYTAALTVKAFSHKSAREFLPERDAWVKYILERQLTAKLGWKPDDKQFGGWGYCRVIPKKPEPNVIAPALIESNLSATTFALDALRAAGVTDAEVYKNAEAFLLRCQNADGGFHFIYDDPTRNKAGMKSTEPLGFHSYGSTTADGRLALALCARDEDEPHRAAAREWLVEHFRADHHPGTYVPAHEPNRDAVYYYYAASVSRALRDADVERAGLDNWPEALATELAKRQRKDGSWVNPIELVRENDPIVATANAVRALSRCRK